MENDRIAITFGTFDLFHIGHLKILERASEYGKLVVGVSTDLLTNQKKGEFPVIAEQERLAIVRSLSCVSKVFFEESLEKKMDYIREYRADTLIMGNDWQDKFDFCKDICGVVYLSRTENISTTEIKGRVRSSSSSIVRNDHYNISVLAGEK